MKTSIKLVLFFLAFFQIVVAARFNNPLLTNVTFPGAIKVNDVYYVVGSGPDSSEYNIEIFSSTDLNSLKSAGTIFPQNWTHPWGVYLNSPEIHEVDGSFNVYYTAQNRRSGRPRIGVATSSTPGGPYKDLGQPLLESSGYAYTAPTLVREGTL